MVVDGDRDSADIGSPCVPETTTQTLCLGAVMMSCGRSRTPSGNAQQAEIVRDLGDAVHAAAEERDLAAELLRQIEDHLQAVNRRAEAGDHQPSLGAVEDSSMRGRTARSLSVYPGRSTLVESDISSSTPRLP